MKVRRFLFLRYNRKERDVTFYKLNIYTIMKELIDILTSEDKSFDFPWWVYVFVAPVALVLVCGLAGSLA